MLIISYCLYDYKCILTQRSFTQRGQGTYMLPLSLLIRAGSDNYRGPKAIRKHSEKKVLKKKVRLSRKCFPGTIEQIVIKQ